MKAIKNYLAELPDRIDLAEMTFVHANPYNPRGWRYVTDRKYALRSFAATDCKYLFIGHSHRPLLIKKKHFLSVDIQAITGPTQVKISGNKRLIINCGSVGQPRDNDTRASYLIFDTRKHTIEFHRIPYDYSITVNAMKKNALPASLYKRLLKGT